jgi:hypothetical protein
MSRSRSGKRNSQIDLGGLALVISVRRSKVELLATVRTLSLE